MRRSGAELPGLLAQRLNDLGVKRGSRITVACSGGADSAAVADALGSGGAYSVLLAWVDHGLRGAEASEAEYRTVRMIAERISSPLATARVEPGEIERESQTSGDGLEMTARRYRYRLLGDIANREVGGAAPVVVTAHHAEDEAETAIMRIAEGRSPLERLSIPEERSGPIRIVRPALGLARSVLTEWVERRCVPFVRDESNRNPRFTRNRVRSFAVPALREIHPRAAEHFASFAREHSGLLDAVRHLIPKEAWGSVVQDAGAPVWTGNAGTLLGLPSSAAELILRAALYRISVSRRVSGGAAREALRRLGQVGPTGHSVPLVRTGDVGVELVGENVRIDRRVVPYGESGYLLNVSEAHLVHISFSREGAEIYLNRSPRTGYYHPHDLEQTIRPTVVRNARRGDRIRVKGKDRALHEVVASGLNRGRIRAATAVIEDPMGVAAVIVGCRRLVERDAPAVGRALDWRPLRVTMDCEDDISHAEQ